MEKQSLGQIQMEQDPDDITVTVCLFVVVGSASWDFPIQSVTHSLTACFRHTSFILLVL